ncbi:formylglycine-generating enzyme family protein [Prosthecobacter sp.]|uniref:formylglycine-generating enzyme family protein n=1 Tax=Prosthecobacter sp. TaxID=1965333 RepID=UPI0037833E04
MSLNAPSTLVSIKAALPSLWFAGQARSPRMQAVCSPGADVHQVRVKLSSDAFPDGGCELHIQSAHAGQASEPFPLTITPVKAGHFRLVVEVSAAVPGILTQRWRTDLPMVVRPLPRSARDLQGMLNGVSMSLGEKALYGQLVSDANVHIGPKITVNADSFDQALEAALSRADAEALGEMQTVPPSAVEENCRSWTSHTGMALQAVPAGKFRMGASEGDAEANVESERVREVTMKKCFWMGRTPVTQAQYRATMGTVPDPGFASHVGHDKPVTKVSWDEARVFCERLTQIEREANALPAGFAYRLPTEAEWELACRAGTRGARYEALEKIALVAETGNQFADTGLRTPNAWGLHDMLGLVYEWCQDVYAPYLPLMTVDPLNEAAPSGPLNQAVSRVVRGGSYQDPAVHARASARQFAPPDRRSGRVGFRVVLGHALTR